MCGAETVGVSRMILGTSQELVDVVNCTGPMGSLGAAEGQNKEFLVET
jgi:hypothetical protein